MPNQNNPDPNTNSATPQSVGSSQPISPVFPQSDLPPLPPDFQSVVSSSPAPTTASPSPKKKFGGGRIIATILGLFLLVGGIGAGVFLIGQNQNIEEKAGSCESLNNGNGCGPGLRCNGSGGCVPVNAPDDAATVEPKPWKEENNDKNPDGTCINHCGGSGLAFDFCLPAESTKTCNQEALARGYTVPIANGPGNFGNETWFCKTPPPNNASCDGKNGGVLRNDLNKDSCFCGVLQVDTPTGFQSYKSDCGCKKNAEEPTVASVDTPTAPPSITAQCQNIKAYSPAWALLSATQLSALTTGSQVNFCVTGSASDGTFDKAKFTINGTAQAETTTVRPGSTDFCQSYAIPAGTSTFNVTARIHHTTLGWK